MERQVDSGAAGPPSADDAGLPDQSAVELSAGLPDSAPVRLTLPAQPRYLRVARLVASGLANELRFGVDRLDDVRLAIGEACALAAQLGATTISLAYVLDDHTLDVTMDAELEGPSDHVDSDHVDSEHVALVGQVLAVAGSDHQIDRQDRRISVRVSFTDGS